MDILESIAKIHKSQLGGTDVLSSCSLKTIELFYQTVSNLDTTILLTEKSNEIITGFVYSCVGESSPISGFLKKHLLRIIFTPAAFLQIIKSILNKLLFRNKFQWSSELVYIAVDKKHTGKGIATKLIQNLENELLKRNVNEYCLQVFCDNPAVKLYEKLNFETIGTIKKLCTNKYLMKKQIPIRAGN